MNTETLSPEKKQVAQRSTIVSAIVNVLLSVGQVVAGVFSGSQGLIADGLHSLSDLIADFVVLIANHHGHKEPDDDHQYGHYRFENAASLVLGVLLLVVGASMLLSGGIKLQNASSIPVVQGAAIWVALVAIVAKELLFRYMMAAAKRVQSTMLMANAWHARSDAASSLVVAIGILGSMSGYPIMDPIAALLVGFMISKMGWDFAWDALHDLMDRSVSADDQTRIMELLLATPGVMGAHDLRTRKMGDLITLDVHLEVNGQISVEEGHGIAVKARQKVMAEMRVAHIMTHLDPV